MNEISETEDLREMIKAFLFFGHFAREQREAEERIDRLAQRIDEVHDILTRQAM